jgi:vancomycin resistance protein VanJ
MKHRGGSNAAGGPLASIAPLMGPRAGGARPPKASYNARLEWFARCVVALAVAAAVLCAVGYTLGAEHFWLLEQAQYLPYPVYLAPALLAIAVSFKLGRAWRLASMLGLGLLATTVMGLELHTGDAGTDRIRMMTYNIKGYLARNRPEGIALIAREIALHDPDLLVLQDAAELTELEEKSPGAFRAIFGAQHTYSYAEYVVVSRYPLRDCKPRETSTRQRSSRYVTCIVAARGVEVAVITAHFMSPRGALSSARDGQPQAADEWRRNLAVRMSQAETLAEEVRATQRPVILAGDLNAPEASLVVRTLLATGLRDAFSTAGKGYGYTWGHSVRPGISFLRIDHILVSPEIGVAECFVGGPQASPHRPVIADLYLKRRAR